MSFVTSHFLNRNSKQHPISTEQKVTEVDTYLNGINQGTDSVCSTASGLFIQRILKGEYNGDYKDFVCSIINDSERLFKIIIVDDIDKNPQISDDEKVERYNTSTSNYRRLNEEIARKITSLKEEALNNKGIVEYTNLGNTINENLTKDELSALTLEIRKVRDSNALELKILERFNSGTYIDQVIHKVGLQSVKSHECNNINTRGLLLSIQMLDNMKGVICTINASTIGVVKKDGYYFLLDTHKNSSGSKFICSTNSINLLNYITTIYINAGIRLCGYNLVTLSQVK